MARISKRTLLYRKPGRRPSWDSKAGRRVLFLLWTAISLAIFIYSYGFVDFNLTLSSNPAVMSFVTWAQSLAMFNRPLSLNVYLSLIFTLFVLYTATLRHWSTGALKQFPWKFIGLIAIILAFSYPFLSHDVFKYLFAGRMVVDYGLNPHIIPPNHIVGDDWLRFLRWVHTPSPYGPFMTILAIIYYVLGMGKFVPTLYLFKLDQIAWYGLAIFLIGKLSNKITKDKSKVVLSQLIFALNPLILIEWLVNAHNDAPMITLMLLSIYLLTQKKRLSSFFALTFSVGIKYVTIIFLPFIFLKKKFSTKFIVHYLLLILTLTPLLYRYSFQYQPWYVTWLIPLVAILPLFPLTYIVIAYSFGSLLRYIPFIRTGLWGATPSAFALYSFAPPIFVALIIFITRRLRRL
ncbi:MAG: hypothetical protein DRG30_06370 [Epsilonproteobacteria bacterium]|nr:MAG: hypothetical protein DRG30_06370 [Campylobacterota bacterium]